MAVRAQALAVAGMLVANLAFVAAALVLHRLGLATLGPRRADTALLAALLFCASPASVFFSAVYTESPFALCSFAGMLCVTR